MKSPRPACRLVALLGIGVCVLGVPALAQDCPELVGQLPNVTIKEGDGEPLQMWKRPLSLLYDNGPFVTHLGTGVGGADESWLQDLSLNLLSFGWDVSGDYRLADDFTIPPEQTWQINSIIVYAFEDLSPQEFLEVSSVNLRIWNGRPDSNSTVVWGDTITNVLTSSYSTSTYRVRESESGTNSDREIWALVCENLSVQLDSGTYWLDWQVDNGGSYPYPYSQPITILGVTETGDALQYNSYFLAWSGVFDPGTEDPQGFPFLVEGTIVGAPDNDTCESATELSCPPGGGSISERGSTASATFTETPECFDLSGTTPEPVYHDEPEVWYRIRGTGAGILATTCSQHTDFNTQLSVFDDVDENCIELNCVNANNDDDTCADYHQSTVGWMSTAGLDYTIIVHPARYDDGGNFELIVTCEPWCMALAGPSIEQIGDTTCGGSTQITSPDLSWTDVANESGYRWEVRDLTTGAVVASYDAAPNVTTVNVGTLPLGSYSARVMALGDGDVYCDSDWSAECQFQIACARLLAPTVTGVGGAACGETIGQPSPTLTWTNVDNEAGYQWEVRTIYQTPIDGGTTGPDQTSTTLTVELEVGDYYARARALGDGEIFCDSEWSVQCPFQVDYGPQTPDFTWWPEQPKQGQRVRFADLSIGNPVGWRWELPGGVTSEQQNPTWIFDETGAFPIILNVQYPSGWQSIQKTITVAGAVVCGDDVCESFETAWSCPEDCGLEEDESGRAGGSDHRPTVPAAVGGIPGNLGTFWMTEGWVFNPGEETTQIILEYTARDGTDILEAGPFELQPERGFYWENMVDDLFDVTEAGALWLDSTEPVLFVTRQYTTDEGGLKDEGSGTFGQSISGTRERMTIGADQGEIYLTGLRNDSAFRSNFFFQEVDGEPVSVRVNIYDNSGQLIRERVIDVQGHSSESRNLEGLLGQNVQSAYATCEVIDGSGRLAVVDSVVDNISADPTTIDPIHPDQVTAKTLTENHDLVAVVAHNPGALGTVWRSSLTIVNPQTSGPQTLRIEYRPANAGQPRVETMDIQPGQQLRWDDVLVDLFGYTGSASTKGALHVYSPAGVMVDSRTYNQRPDAGTLGQNVPALRSGDLVDSGSRGTIIGLEHNAATRTNIGFTEFTGQDTQVRLLFKTTDEDSIPLGPPIIETVQAYQHLQILEVFNEQLHLGDDEWQGIKAEISVLSGGSVYAYASAVDNTSGDATTFVAVK